MQDLAAIDNEPTGLFIRSVDQVLLIFCILYSSFLPTSKLNKELSSCRLYPRYHTVSQLSLSGNQDRSSLSPYIKNRPIVCWCGGGGSEKIQWKDRLRFTKRNAEILAASAVKFDSCPCRGWSKMSPPPLLPSLPPIIRRRLSMTCRDKHVWTKKNKQDLTFSQRQATNVCVFVYAPVTLTLTRRRWYAKVT